VTRFLIYVFLFSFASALGQKDTINTIEKRGEALYYKNVIKSLAYADSLLQTNEEKYKAFAYYLKGISTHYGVNIDSATIHLKRAIALSENNKNIELLIKSQLELSGIEIFNAGYEEAEYLIENSTNLSQQINSSELKARALYFKSLLNWMLYAQYDVAIGFLYEALETHEDINTITTKLIYSKLAYLLDESGFQDLSLEYLNKVIAQSLIENNIMILSRSYSIYGIILYNNEGIEYLDKSIELTIKRANKLMLGYRYVIQANIYSEDEIGEYEKAHVLYHKGVKLHHEVGNISGLSLAYLNLADLFAGAEKYKDSALYYTKKLEKLTLKYQNNSLNYNIYNAYYKTYKASKQYDKALEYLEKTNIESDKLFNIRINNSILNNNTLYKLKDKELQLLQQDIKLKRAERKQNYLYVMLLVLFIISLGIIYFFFQRHNQKQKLNEQTIQTLKKQEEVKSLAALIKGEDMERSRIAKDLHDGINGSLSAIKYKLSSISLQHFSEDENETFEKALQMLDVACEQIRNISHDLAPPSLLNFGLIEAIEQYCNRINSSRTVTITFQHFGTYKPLSKKIETTIYHIIQELIINIIKHSEAKKAIVQLNTNKNELHLTVEDDGKGYDVKAITHGLGLNNIKSRIEFLNAEMNIQSDAKGTSITIDIDLNKIPKL